MSGDQQWATSATYLREGATRLRALAGISLLTSLWLLAAPFVLGYPQHGKVRALGIDLAVGGFSLCLAGYHALNWRTGRWGSRGVLYLGLGLFVMPAILGYFHHPELHSAGWNDLVCGALLAVGGVLALAGSDSPSESSRA